MKARLPVLIAAAAIASAAPVLALAQAQWSPDLNAPVSIGAEEEGAFNSQTCTGQLKGNVEVTQGRIRLRAKSMTTHQVGRSGDCGDIARLVADGDVYYVTPNESVRADHAVYNLTADTVTFTGGVIVVRGQNVATSQRLVINLKNNDTNLSGRVRGVFYPDRSGQ